MVAQSGNKRAMKAGAAANKLIEQQAGDTGEPANSESEAQLKEVPKTEVEASAEVKKYLSQPKSSTAGAEPAETESDWKARFMGQQAAYQRDVPKLRTELQTAYTDIDKLKGEIESIKEMINKPAELPVDESAALDLSDEEKEQYGPGLISLMERIAEGSRTDLARQVIDLQKKLADVKTGQDTMAERAVVSDEQQFFNAMTNKVPTWLEVNTDPEFLTFLAEDVPYTGRQRHEFLTEARERLDVAKCARIFNDFLKIVPNGSPHADESTSDLEEIPAELVTPQNSGGGMPPIEEEKYFTQGQVTQFYKEKREGKYKGREAEAKKIETDIFAAGNAGRILTDKQAERAYRFDGDDKALKS